jgi:hypothetical protein
MTIVGSAAAIFNIILNGSTLSTELKLLNVVVIVGAFIFSLIRSKKVNMQISYEKA